MPTFTPWWLTEDDKAKKSPSAATPTTPMKAMFFT
jgi:hypothetical protein